MNHEQTSNASWGFVSPDGKIQAISSLNTLTLEYASKSIEQLEELISEYVITEEYEKCAILRDEIARRIR